jgi:hypothetical protein
MPKTVGKLVEQIPLKNGLAVHIREPAPGEGCEVHAKKDEELPDVIIAGMTNGNISVCSECLKRAKTYIKATNPHRKFL